VSPSPTRPLSLFWAVSDEAETQSQKWQAGFEVRGGHLPRSAADFPLPRPSKGKLLIVKNAASSLCHSQMTG
jgi:hypothetical protein